ncbi:hypothetical protein C8J57DRAFT_1301002 [Mycena rebaudengoi]|nr:hypothetical protein C8J57DRAFT_1301002 [Mycena rebaudengoi]
MLLIPTIAPKPCAHRSTPFQLGPTIRLVRRGTIPRTYRDHRHMKDCPQRWATYFPSHHEGRIPVKQYRARVRSLPAPFHGHATPLGLRRLRTSTSCRGECHRHQQPPQPYSSPKYTSATQRAAPDSARLPQQPRKYPTGRRATGIPTPTGICIVSRYPLSNSQDVPAPMPLPHHSRAGGGAESHVRIADMTLPAVAPPLRRRRPAPHILDVPRSTYSTYPPP